MATFKKIIQLELNEVSRSIIDRLIAHGKLPNFKFIQNHWTHLSTTSEDQYENIEPWIQWTSAHTGKSFAEHGVFHLGDSEKLREPQIWEELSNRGVESAIVGSMNANRGGAKSGIFFSDPWAKKNECYPESIKPLWDLISQKVQEHATSNLRFSDLVRGLLVCLKFKLPLRMYVRIAVQLVSQKLNPKNKWKLACIFDEFLSKIFKSILKTTDFGFYTLFLNANAHYQHHYWRNFDSSPFDRTIQYDDIEAHHDPITYGYESYDRILGDLLRMYEGRDDVLFVVATGLSQEPYTKDEIQGGMNYYRLRNHREFAAKIGLGEFEIFPLMSRDWQIRYRNDRERIVKILEGFRVQGEPLFKVSEENPGYLFVETAYTKGVDETTRIYNPAIASPESAMAKVGLHFYSEFANTAIKSGHHSGIGSLWLSKPLAGFEKEKNQVQLTDLYFIPLKIFPPIKGQ